MSVLLRASELEGRPIVAFAGESPAEVKDVIFDSRNGALFGLTLCGHGLWVAGDRLLGVGSHAVVVREAPPAEAAPGRS